MISTLAAHWGEAVGTLGVGILTWVGVKLKTISQKTLETQSRVDKISETTKSTHYEIRNDHATNVRDDIDKSIELTREVSGEVKKMSQLMSESLLRIDTRISGVRESLNKEIQERQSDISDVRGDLSSLRVSVDRARVILEDL